MAQIEPVRVRVGDLQLRYANFFSRRNYVLSPLPTSALAAVGDVANTTISTGFSKTLEISNSAKRQVSMRVPDRKMLSALALTR